MQILTCCETGLDFLTENPENNLTFSKLTTQAMELQRVIDQLDQAMERPDALEVCHNMKQYLRHYAYAFCLNLRLRSISRLRIPLVQVSKLLAEAAAKRSALQAKVLMSEPVGPLPCDPF